MAADFFPFRLRASSLGRYPIFSITARTRLAVAGARPDSSFNTLDAVFSDTFAVRATSTSVGLLVFRIIGLRRNALSKSAPPGKSGAAHSTYRRRSNRQWTTLSLVAAINLGCICLPCQSLSVKSLDRNLRNAVRFRSFFMTTLSRMFVLGSEVARNECCT